MNKYKYYKSIVNINKLTKLGGAVSGGSGGGAAPIVATSSGDDTLGSSPKHTTLETSEFPTEAEILGIVREFIIHRSSRLSPDALELKKVIYILRGIPGIGKSTWSRGKLIEKGLESNPKEHLFANDNFLTFYLTSDGEVSYSCATNEQILQSESIFKPWTMKRHEKVFHTQSAVYLAMEKAEAEGIDTNLIIIDNTNSSDWELKIWLLLAIQFDYDVVVVEFDSRHLDLDDIHKKLSRRPRLTPPKGMLRDHSNKIQSVLIESDKYLGLEQSAIEEAYSNRILDSKPPADSACIYPGVLGNITSQNVFDYVQQFKDGTIRPYIVNQDCSDGDKGGSV